MEIDDKEKIFDTKEDEKFTEAYLEQLELDTPDLWNKIEAGLDGNDSVTSKTENNKAEDKASRKIITFPHIAGVLIAVAVILAAVIVVPLLTGDGKKSKKGDGALEGWWNKNNVQSDEESVAADSAAGAEEEADMDTDSADSAEASDAAGEEAATSEQIDNTEEKSEAPATTENSTTEENTAGATETTTEAGENTTEATTSEQTDKNYVMVNGYVYTSNGETVDAVPQGFELAGQVKTEDSDGVPTEDMQSHNVAAGTNIYTSSVNSYYIYVQSSEGKYEMYVVD